MGFLLCCTSCITQSTDQSNNESWRGQWREDGTLKPHEYIIGMAVTTSPEHCCDSSRKTPQDEFVASHASDRATHHAPSRGQRHEPRSTLIVSSSLKITTHDQQRRQPSESETVICWPLVVRIATLPITARSTEIPKPYTPTAVFLYWVWHGKGTGQPIALKMEPIDGLDGKLEHG